MLNSGRVLLRTTISGSLLLLALLATVSAVAEDGYYYGLHLTSREQTRGFGRINIASGEQEILNASFYKGIFQTRFGSAIDVRRSQMLFVNLSGELYLLDLQTGELLLEVDNPGLRSFGEIDEWHYDEVTDKYYGARILPPVGLVEIDPLTLDVGLVNLETELAPVVFFSALDSRTGTLYLLHAQDLYALDLSSRELSFVGAIALQSPLLLQNVFFDPPSGLLYAQESESRKLGPTNILEIDPLDATVLSRREIQLREGDVNIRVRYLTDYHVNSGNLVAFWLNEGMALTDVDRAEYSLRSTWEEHELFDSVYVSFRGRIYNARQTLFPVQGHVYVDQNENCSMQSSEDKLQGQIVRVDPGGVRTFSRKDGAFNLNLPQGEYVVGLEARWPWESACSPESRRITIDADGIVEGSANVGLIPKALIENLDVSVVSSQAIAGREIEYHITCINTGSMRFDGVLRFNYDSRLTDFDSERLADRHTIGLAEWDIVDMAVGATKQFKVSLMIPPDENLRGLEICARVEIGDVKPDDLLRYRQDQTCVQIRASFDPNDISVSPRGFGERGQITQDDTTLTYTIRFQNIGDAPAFDVVVRNYLDDDLDVNTLNFGAASHDYSVNLLDGKVLEFRFADIKLPGKETDEPGSHGVVKYKVDVKKNLEEGTEVRSRAAIYFDFNKPILTNTVVNTIAKKTTDVATTSDSDQLELRSLGNGLFVLHSTSNSESLITVYSMLGTKVYESQLEARGTMSLNLHDQRSGVYLIRFESEGMSSIKSVPVIR